MRGPLSLNVIILWTMVRIFARGYVLCYYYFPLIVVLPVLMALCITFLPQISF